MTVSTGAIKHISVTKLIPYASNSRTHSNEQVAQIAASIKEFGFTNPVLIDGDNGIIAGHGRVMAAKLLGLDKVPTIELSHLTKAQRKAYIIADNKLAMNAAWDLDTLKMELQVLGNEGFDLTLTGFDQLELANLFDDGERDGSTQEIDPEKYTLNTTCPKCGFEFNDKKA